MFKINDRGKGFENSCQSLSTVSYDYLHIFTDITLEKVVKIDWGACLLIINVFTIID